MLTCDLTVLKPVSDLKLGSSKFESEEEKYPLRERFGDKRAL